jgi:hypothetical protein
VWLPQIKLGCLLLLHVARGVSSSAAGCRWQLTLRIIPNKTRINQQIPNEPASHQTAAQFTSQRPLYFLVIRTVALHAIT